MPGWQKALGASWAASPSWVPTRTAVSVQVAAMTAEQRTLNYFNVPDLSTDHLHGRCQNADLKNADSRNSINNWSHSGNRKTSVTASDLALTARQDYQALPPVTWGSVNRSGDLGSSAGRRAHKVNTTGLPPEVQHPI